MRAPVARRNHTAVVVRGSPGIGPLVVLGMLVASPIGLAFTLEDSTYDTWGGFIWGPVLMLLAYPLCRWVANKAGEPEIAGFLFGAATLKVVVGSMVRYYMVDSLYGRGDSVSYDRAATGLAGSFREGVFTDLGKISGTRFIEVLNGLVHAVIGNTMVGSFLVFSGFGFVGLCLLYLAFCEALPDGDRTLYRRLLFLAPSLWFWPSSVGKEAFLMLCVGATAYGFARLFNGRPLGVLPAGAGLWGATIVRPHIALMLLVGGVVALPTLFRVTSAKSEAEPQRAVARVLLPLLLLLALPFSLQYAERFFGIGGLNLESATEVRDSVIEQTSEGGGDFAAPDTNTPLGLVEGLVTVVARPFPWEAGGFQAVTAAETIGLVAIMTQAVWSRRRGIIRAWTQRWPRLSIAYVLAFAWAFSAVSNFGILARQRSLMLPFVFVLAAVIHRPVAELEPDQAMGE